MAILSALRRSSVEVQAAAIVNTTAKSKRDALLKNYETLPIIFLSVSVIILSFGLGAIFARYDISPVPQLQDGAKTIMVVANELIEDAYFGEFVTPASDGGEPETSIPVSDVGERRFRPLARDFLADKNLLVMGGLNQYLDLCPGNGCIGVEIGRDGEILHAYPFRPDEIFGTDITGGAFRREGVLLSAHEMLRPMDLFRYPNGDLLVTFHTRPNAGVYPFATGVARIDRDGHPRWRRYDYTHHWGKLLDSEQVIVPTLEIGEGPLLARRGPSEVTLDCRSGRPLLDKLQVLDGNGAVVREIGVLSALLESPMSALVLETTDGCDPLHLNSVDVIGPEAGVGLDPGDIVISLRNLSAFAILDWESGAVERVVRGTFIQQHAVRHLEGSKFLLFDNHGAELDNNGAKIGPSRLLEVDLATGKQRTVFPSADAPPELAAPFSRFHGQIDISKDRRRALVSFTDAGRGFEIDVSTGEVLFAYDNLHDLTAVGAAPQELRVNAARARLYGMKYLDANTSD